MNIYQRIVLIAGAIAVIFVLLTAPKFASVPSGNMKLKINKINANTRNVYYYETDVPKLAIREFAVIAVTALVFFALMKRKSNVVRDSSDQTMLVDEHSNRKFGDLSRFKKLFQWFMVPIIVLLVLIAILITLKVLRNYNFIHHPPTIMKVDPAMASSAGGTEITITGTGFKAMPAPAVTIQGNPATGVKVTSKTTLKATVPPFVDGPADIVVQNAKAKVMSLPFKGFTYYEDVAIIMTDPDPATAPPEGIKAPANITVIFNQEVDPTSVMIKVAGADGTEIAGTSAQDTIDPMMFIFTPFKPFKAGDYTVTVLGAKGVTASNVMPADYSMTFRVRRTSSKNYKK
jgi:hypothetical protein